MASGMRPYRDGRIAIENGATTVIGDGTIFVGNALAGNPVRMPDGFMYVVDQDADENTSFEIYPPYRGDTVEDSEDYVLLRFNDRLAAAATQTQRLKDFLDNLAVVEKGTAVPDPSLGGIGTVYWRYSGNTIVSIYVKDESGWGVPISTTLSPELEALRDQIEAWKDDTQAAAVSGAASATTALGYRNAAQMAATDAAAFAGEAATSATAAATSETGAAASATGANASRVAAAASATAADTSRTAAAASATAASGSATTATTKAGEASTSATNAAASATAAANSANAANASKTSAETASTNADNKAAAAAASAASSAASAAIASAINSPVLVAKSTTPIITGTGPKVFTLVDDANFIVTQRVRAASKANGANFMSGLVSNWNSGTKELSVDVDLLGPSPGSASDWNISVTGEKGDQGPPGGFGSLLPTKGNEPIGDGTTYGAFPVGANGTMQVADSSQTYGRVWRPIDAVLADAFWTVSDVPSAGTPAGTCDIGAAITPCVRITGTTTITSLGTAANQRREVEFAGSLTLTYNGTSLILPGTANIITQAGDKGVFRSDAFGNWKCVSWTPIGFLPREKLIANRTYYVKTSANGGDDTKDGLTIGTAFATIQRAENVARTIDFNGFTVTISIGDGTYTAGVTVGLKLGQAATSNYRFTSTSQDATKVTISLTSASCFNGLAPFTVDRVTMQTTTSGSGIWMQAAGLVQFSNVIFGPCATYCLNLTAPGAKIQAVGPFTIAGNCGAFAVASDGAHVQCESTTITLTGTPAFTQFVLATRLGGILMRAMTFSGSATGVRYSATINGAIETGGGGASYFPGSSAGSFATGGQYN
ncbi:hypothetical protein [Hyphomicrobium sp. ghe19]|uniref:hypothetical protein n=1 Tax=Hyphomicrobium sp. ghe19 TaxID=2682968 RepID=UPI00136797CF|nr:hypothetical protein HYPP_03758 [Hyphomicrobium sp. ghe19]